MPIEPATVMLAAEHGVLQLSAKTPAGLASLRALFQGEVPVAGQDYVWRCTRVIRWEDDGISVTFVPVPRAP